MIRIKLFWSEGLIIFPTDSVFPTLLGLVDWLFPVPLCPTKPFLPSVASKARLSDDSSDSRLNSVILLLKPPLSLHCFKSSRCFFWHSRPFTIWPQATSITHHSSCTIWRKQDIKCQEGSCPRSHCYRLRARVPSLLSAVATDPESPGPAEPLKCSRACGLRNHRSRVWIMEAASDLIRLTLKSHSLNLAEAAGRPPFLPSSWPVLFFSFYPSPDLILLSLSSTSILVS